MAGLINVSDPRWGTLASRKALQTANQMVLPWAGARAQLSKLMAPGKQEFDGELQRALADAIPGGRNIIGVNRVDILNNKEMNPGDVANHIWNTLLPFDANSSDNNNVAGRLAELGVDINFEFSDTMKGIKLSAAERQLLNKYIAETGLGKDLDRLMSKDWFKAEVEEWKESNLGHEPPPRWLRAISKQLSTAKRRAKARMMRENPTFAEKVDLNTQTKDLIRRGRYEKGSDIQQQLEQLLDYR